MGPLPCVSVRPQLRFVLPAASTALALALVLAIVLDGSPGGSSRHPTTRNGSFDGATFPPNVRAHDFTLSDQRGRSVSLSDYRGQVMVLAFLSTDCRACVLVAQQVRGALDELATTEVAARGSTAGVVPGVQTLFVSTDPRADTPTRVGRFLGETSLTGRVEYLTGTSTWLQPVWHAYGIAPTSTHASHPRQATSAHGALSASEASLSVLLIDRVGGERVGFGLEQITPEGLAHDIRLLQAG
jgi:protein SCO1